MIDACVNMMVRDGEDFVQPCLEAVLPHVKRAIVVIDSRSKDGTREIIQGMLPRWKNLETYTHTVNNPLTDLVAVRNFMLHKVKEKYIWIIDSDEYYPEKTVKEIDNILEKYWGFLAIGFTSWAVWNKKMAHMITSNRPTVRIVRMTPWLEWDGIFGREKLKLGEIDLCHDFLVFKQKYIHFTHVKSDGWRGEMGFKRRIDINNMALVPLPAEIRKIVRKLYDKEKNV